MSKDGWALTLLGGKTWGDGYIQGTEFSAYNYFVNIAKRINDAHQISFTAFGSPQWHNQRSNKDGLSIKGWQAVKIIWVTRVRIAIILLMDSALTVSVCLLRTMNITSRSFH